MGWFKRRKGDGSRETAEAFHDRLNATPGEWFPAPDVIAGSYLDAVGRAAFVLDPTMYDTYRDEPDAPLFARRRPRPEGLPEPPDCGPEITYEEIHGHRVATIGGRRYLMWDYSDITP